MSGSLSKSISKFFSDSNQLQRIVVLLGIALVLAVISFGSFYYYDRYYTSQPNVADTSIGQAEQAVRENPDDPAVRLKLAEVYMANSRFDEALEVANPVMELYPDNQHAWFVVGVANALGGNPADAVVPLEKFLEANKDIEMPGLNKALQSAAFYLGDSYLVLNQADKAILPLENAVNWGETDADAKYKLGMAYLGVQRYEEALGMFQGATLFVPNYTESYEGMITAFEALNAPDYADYARGMVAYSKQDYDTAIKLLLSSSQAIPDFPPVFVGLGLTYENIGDLENARTSYEKVLAMESENFAASTGLERVNALLNK